MGAITTSRIMQATDALVRVQKWIDEGKAVSLHRTGSGWDERESVQGCDIFKIDSGRQLAHVNTVSSVFCYEEEDDATIEGKSVRITVVSPSGNRFTDVYECTGDAG